jgi:primosomal protein N' (replication factor Y) (superfamily II helicase)
MYSNGINLLNFVVNEPGESYQSKTAVNRYIEVLVDCPGNSGLFTYLIPTQLEIKPGDILSVPFGTQQLGAVAVRLLAEPNIDLAQEKIREVEDVVSAGFFSSAYWELINKVATYYYTPLIQVIRVALPPGLLGRSQRRIRLTNLAQNQKTATQQNQLLSSPSFLSPSAQQILNLLQTQPAGDYSSTYLQQKVKFAYRGIKELLRFGLAESYLEPPRATKPKLQKAVILIGIIDRDLTTRQREILEVLKRRGGELWQNELLQMCNASSSILKTMAQKGCIVIEEREVLRTEQSPALAHDPGAKWICSSVVAWNHRLWQNRGIFASDRTSN